MIVSKREMMDRLHKSMINKGKCSDLCKAELERIVDMYFDLVAEAILAGDGHRLGGIGTIGPKIRRGRRFKLPGKDEWVDVADKTVCAIRLTPGFLAALNGR